MSVIVNPSLTTMKLPDNIRYSVDKMKMACDPVDFGHGEDNSGTRPTQAVHENYAWLEAIFRGAATRRVNGNLQIVEYVTADGHCEKRIKVGQQANLVPVAMEGTPCCVKLPEMEGRAFFTDVKPFCVEDCLTDDDIFYLVNQTGSQLTLQSNVLALRGSDAYQRRIDLLRRVFIFQMARQFLLGEDGVYGDNLTPFTGVMELLTRASVVNLDGAALMSVLETLNCYFEAIPGDWIALGNRFAIKAVRDMLDRAYQITGERMALDSIRFFDVSMLDVSDAFTTDLILLNLDHVGAIVDVMSLNPATRTLEVEEDVNDDMSVGACKVICNRIRGRGGLFTDDFNSVIRISNITVPAACLPVIGRMLNTVGVDTMLPR